MSYYFNKIIVISAVFIFNLTFCLTSSAFETIRPENDADRAIASAQAFDQKIAVAKRYLAGGKNDEKISAIKELEKLGGEAVPVLLEQLKIELSKPKETVVLGGIDQKVESPYISYIIDALGHTKDKRTIDPLINIVKSDSPSRWDAIVVLGVIGSIEDPTISTYRKQAKPSKGCEIKEEDRKKIKNILITVLNDKDEAIRMEAITALGSIGATDVIPILKSISENDPYSTEKIDEKGKRVKGVKVYPVRDEAKTAIEGLKNEIALEEFRSK